MVLDVSLFKPFSGKIRTLVFFSNKKMLKIKNTYFFLPHCHFFMIFQMKHTIIRKKSQKKNIVVFCFFLIIQHFKKSVPDGGGAYTEVEGLTNFLKVRLITRIASKNQKKLTENRDILKRILLYFLMTVCCCIWDSIKTAMEVQKMHFFYL